MSKGIEDHGRKARTTSDLAKDARTVHCVVDDGLVAEVYRRKVDADRHAAVLFPPGYVQSMEIRVNVPAWVLDIEESGTS